MTDGTLKPTLYAYATAVFRHNVAGTLFDHEGEPIHSHVSSSEGWLWHDLTTGFEDRRLELERRYPDGYDVVYLGQRSTDEERKPLFDLWDAKHPGWRDQQDGDAS